MNIPSNLLYTNTDEWVRVEDDGTIVVGITDYAQGQLGEVVYVDLPSLSNDDDAVDVGDDVCVVESVKAAADIYAPIAGMIVEVNYELQEMPSCLNNDPYGDGWLFRLKPASMDDCEQLMSSEDYEDRLSDVDTEE